MKVHIQQLPINKIHIILNPVLQDFIILQLRKKCKSIAEIARFTKISKSVTSRFISKKHDKIRLDFLLKMTNLLSIQTNKLERNIQWIGHQNSKGINNPKLPFTFNSRSAARFLAAICNEGWISDGAYYSNSSKELRRSVKLDSIKVFGDCNHSIRDHIKENDQYLAFPAIIREVLQIITSFKGIKSENNPHIPKCIFQNKQMMCGWIEQTIADEGSVMHYPHKYRREISWRRTFSTHLRNYHLIEDEVKLLKYLMINFNLNQMETYKTSTGKSRVRMQIRLACRNNLINLRKLIKIPCSRKDSTFSEMLKGFVRYKEPITLRNAIISLCKKNTFITSNDVKIAMGYNSTGAALRWLKKFTNEGLLYESKKYSYTHKVGRTCIKYALA
tara:strand:+ start:2299 stop:3462 length:1164 start_codon:yes stop_codon:yes gene_type:complete